MFTGIIEQLGTIHSITKSDDNITFGIDSTMAVHLKIDQSVAHNGVCLTVVAIRDNVHFVTAIWETLQKTALGNWQVNHTINLERAMMANARLDGHFVQGHVDATGVCTQALDQNGSWLYTISYPEKFAALIIEKGSICLNGISLTCFDVTMDTFSVAIIPYTFEHTNMHALAVGDTVNIEFDILGKYILRMKEVEKDN
jgi:riboflavin synthase